MRKLGAISRTDALREYPLGTMVDEELDFWLKRMEVGPRHQDVAVIGHVVPHVQARAYLRPSDCVFTEVTIARAIGRGQWVKLTMLGCAHSHNNIGTGLDMPGRPARAMVLVG